MPYGISLRDSTIVWIFLEFLEFQKKVFCKFFFLNINFFLDFFGIFSFFMKFLEFCGILDCFYGLFGLFWTFCSRFNPLCIRYDEKDDPNSGLLYYLMAHHLWIFAIPLVPISLGYDLFWWLRTRWTFWCCKSNANLRHDDKVRKIRVPNRGPKSGPKSRSQITVTNGGHKSGYQIRVPNQGAKWWSQIGVPNGGPTSGYQIGDGQAPPRF
jgi:hypothetical protein